MVVLFPNHFIMADTTRGDEERETPTPSGAPVPPKK